MDRFGNFLVNFFFGSWERTRGTLIFVGIIVLIFWILNNQGIIVNFFNEILAFLYNVLMPFGLWVALIYFGFSLILKSFKGGKKK